MKTTLLVIAKFTDGVLIVEIAVIERDNCVDIGVFKVTQVMLDDSIDQWVGIRQGREKILPHLCLLDPSGEWLLKFGGVFLIISQGILFGECVEQWLGYLRI